MASSAYLGHTLNQMRRDQRAAFEVTEKREQKKQADTRAKDVVALIGSGGNWRTLIAQVAADVTGTAVALDEAGVLNATLQPTPYFTVIATDGREFCFTVDHEVLRSMRIIPDSAQVIDVAKAGGATTAVDLHIVWTQITAERRMSSMALPIRAHWFCIVKNPHTASDARNRRGAPKARRAAPFARNG